MRQGSPAAAKSLSTWWSRSRSISCSPSAGIDETASSIGGISGLVESINASCCEISGRIKNDELINILINEQAGVIRENAEMIKAAMKEQKNAIVEIVKTITVISRSVQGTVDAAADLSRSGKWTYDLAHKRIRRGDHETPGSAMISTSSGKSRAKSAFSSPASISKRGTRSSLSRKLLRIQSGARHNAFYKNLKKSQKHL